MDCFNTIVLVWTFVVQIVSGSNLLLLSDASSTFSQRLYPLVASNKQNVVYSPFSIHLSLTMAYNGARQTTAAQMADILSLDSLNGSSPHEVYRSLITQMTSVEDVTLLTGNALFVNPRNSINPDFNKVATDDYFSQVSNFNLTAPEGPEQAINDYVARKTKDMIPNLLNKGTISSSTVLLIVNTLFFNGTWKKQFEKYRTHDKTFNQLNGLNTTVKMMSDSRAVDYKKDDQRELAVVQLPFLNKRFGLYIVLPHQIDGITKLENLLNTPSEVKALFNGLESKRVAVSIPRFKIETSLSLKEPLQNLGMVDAFSVQSANFSGITPTGVFISDVVHKAVIDVQETGTVAAASTLVAINSKSLMLPPPDSFQADHPFLFFLRDNETKQILFQGKFSG